MIGIGIYSEDRALLPILASALGKEYNVRLESQEDGINRMHAAGVCDVVIIDLDSNDVSLKARIAAARRIVGTETAVIMADDTLRSTALELVRLGAHGYCRKPPSIRDLKAMLNSACENASLKRKLRDVQGQLDAASKTCDQMIGFSSPMQQVYDLVRRVANLNASVLVTGESGTGKELIAQAIHNLGTRADRPFVAVSCGAIPETLIEAELFGHEKGAYTGTVGAREGYLEKAADGTLFLDEIGELSLATQVKLLRVIQQREFSRLGSNRVIPLRARLVFATHQDLGAMIARGTFRQDLYYRINVMRIDAPPLQDHAEDIPTIATHFLRKYSEQYQKLMEDFDPGAMSLLQGYSWPGNVRELENVVQRAIIICQGTSIRREDLPAYIQEEGVLNIGEYQAAGSFGRQLRDYKVKLASTAVKDNDGNKTLAAKSLQISHAYLHRLIRLADAGPEIDLEAVDTEMA